MSVSSPDSIYSLDQLGSASLVQESQTQAASIQAALAKRERYSFTWANSAERTAQTGMVTGSEGYQLDTSTNYFYTGSQWTPSVVRFFGTQLTNVTNNNGTNIQYTVVEDTASGYSSGNYTIQHPGVYLLAVGSKQNASPVSYSLVIFKNGVPWAYTPNGIAANFSGNNLTVYITLAAGDQIAIQPTNPFTTQNDSPAHNNFLQLIRIY